MSKPKKKQLAVASIAPAAPVSAVPPLASKKDSPTLEGATYKPGYMQEREALSEFASDNARLVLYAFDALKEPGDATYKQMLVGVSDDALMQAAATIAAASVQKFGLDDIWNAVERVRDELAKANRFRYGG